MACSFCELDIEAPYKCFLAEQEFGCEEVFKAGNGTQMKVCFSCAKEYDGQDIVSPMNEEFMLVCEHDDFPAVETRVAEVVRTMRCQYCNGPIGKNPDDNFGLARRALRFTPGILTDPELSIKWTCAECTNHCEECDDEGNHEH